MLTSDWFQVRTLLPACFRLVSDDLPVVTGTEVVDSQVVEQARAAVSRLSRTHHEMRDVLRAMADAMDWLRAEVLRLDRENSLAREGMVLRESTVLLGGGGITLCAPEQVFGPRATPVGSAVRVWLTLTVRQQTHLLTLPTRVQGRDNVGLHLDFDGVRADQRDLVIAYAFQQQALERRRARDPSRSSDPDSPTDPSAVLRLVDGTQRAQSSQGPGPGST